jgi:hypothetical protein
LLLKIPHKSKFSWKIETTLIRSREEEKAWNAGRALVRELKEAGAGDRTEDDEGNGEHQSESGAITTRAYIKL